MDDFPISDELRQRIRFSQAKDTARGLIRDDRSDAALHSACELAGDHHNIDAEAIYADLHASRQAAAAQVLATQNRFAAEDYHLSILQAA